MGTNYYLLENVCECCGRGDEPLHIGKSSAGWCFGLHVIPEDGINDLLDWERRWSAQGTRIVDEYGSVLTPEQMRCTVAERTWPVNRPRPPQWYQDNTASAGPFGLARHAVYPGHCIGHGAGTWDLLIGEFS